MAIFTYKINFRLNKGLRITNTKKPYTLFFRYRQGRTVEFSASTGIKISLEDWNTNTQKLRQKAHIKNRYKKNSFLTGLVDYFDNKMIEFAKNQNAPTRTQIKNLYNEYVNPTPIIEKLKFFDFIDSFIEKAKTTPNQHTKKIVSNGTLRGYKATKNILLKFNKEHYKLTFENVNLQFYYDFIKVCQKENLSYNYIGKHIKTLKTFLLSAFNENLTTNLDFKKKEFATLKEDTDEIYLTENELNKMYNLDLSQSPHLDKVRDLFLIGCYTGLRFSDWHKVNSKNIQNETILNISTQKTDKTVSIPIHSIVQNILNKYKGTPPVLYAHNINKNIKTIGKLASIDTETTHKSPTRNNLKTNIQKPKYELIKTHTARRSFCTNAYISEMPTLDIMAISGHTTESSFLRYIKITGKQQALKMAKHKFFNNSLNLKAVK